MLPLFALPVLWLAGYFFPPINHDVAAILDISARWLAGEKLYVDDGRHVVIDRREEIAGEPQDRKREQRQHQQLLDARGE